MSNSPWDNSIVLTDAEREALAHAAAELRGLHQAATDRHWFELYDKHATTLESLLARASTETKEN